jgi:hypothetical protein
MLDVLHRKLVEQQDELAQGALTAGSLGMDSYVQYILVRGKYAGLQMAIDTIENIMQGKVDPNG